MMNGVQQQKQHQQVPLLIGEESKSFAEMDFNTIRNLGVIPLAISMLCLPQIELIIKAWVGLYALHCLVQVVLLAIAILESDSNGMKQYRPVNILFNLSWWILGVKWMVSDIRVPYPPLRLWLVVVLLAYHVFFYILIFVSEPRCSEKVDKSERV